MGSSGERTFFYSTCQRLAGNEEEPVKEEYFLDDLHFSPPTFFFLFLQFFRFLSPMVELSLLRQTF
jgi:hypothetical protein